MKILHCVPTLNYSDGGPARSVPSLAAAQARCGADVRVWTRRMPTIDLSSYCGVGFVSGEMAEIELSSWRPDVIHDHGIWRHANHQSAQVCRRNRIIRIVSPRGMLEPWSLNHHKLRKQVAWRLYQHKDLQSATAFHATATEEAANIRALGFNQPVIQLPNGVGLPDDSDRQRLVVSGEKEVLFLSRIHPKKGLLNLIQAWKQAAGPGWTLRIVGPDEGGHRQEVCQAIESNDVASSVTIQSSVCDHGKWDILRNASVTILPSFSENFGIVNAESLAVGTPVITTTGTPWQEVAQRRCGWCVEPTVEALGAALKAAMATPAVELSEMGRRGKEWVLQEFSWDDIGGRMLASYERLLAGESLDAVAAGRQRIAA